jgi:hypothetical protein
VITGNFGSLLSQRQRLIQITREMRDRADPHAGAVSPAVVKAHLEKRPLPERAAIFTVRVQAHVSAEVCSKFTGIHQAVRHGYGAGRIVGECASLAEERKVLRFEVPPFVNRSDDVTCDRSQHAGTFT